MKRFALLLIALLAVVPFTVSAQTTPSNDGANPSWTPTPTPINPHEYNDAAMHFDAPPAWRLVGYRVLPLSALGDDLQVVAGWTNGDANRPQAITISQESFEGNVSNFETRFENDMRQQYDNILVKSKAPTTLLNGMPAYFLDMSYGEGFTARKQFALLWADGSRGVAISVMGRVGEIDAATAKKLISNVSAVRYPFGRE